MLEIALKLSTKEYLGQLRWYDSLVKTKTEQIRQLRETLYGLSSINYSNTKVQAGSQFDKMTSGIAHLESMEAELANEIEQMCTLKRDIMEKISRIPYANYQIILIMRYFNFKTFEEIAEEMDITVQWLNKLHKKALDYFETNFLKNEI